MKQEENLQSNREKQLAMYSGTPKGLSADFSAGASWPEGVAQCIPRAERKNVLTKSILSGRAVGQTEGSRKSDAGVQHQKAALQAKLEGHFKAEKKKKRMQISNRETYNNMSHG